MGNQARCAFLYAMSGTFKAEAVDFSKFRAKVTGMCRAYRWGEVSRFGSRAKTENAPWQ
jgi:hypothetical protein